MENNEQQPVAYSSMIEKFQKTHIGKNVLHTALEEIKTPEEVKQFYDEYVEMTKEMILSGDPDKTAKDNIKMVLPQFDAATQELWKVVL